MSEYIIIVAIARNGVIGRQGKLPWHLPSDLKHFKETTMNYPIIMGRKTYDSIGKPLPGRDNVILTRNTSRDFPGCFRMNTLQEALDHCNGQEKIFIIGGGDIFKVTLPIANTIIVTAMKRDVDGDVYFPEIDTSKFRQADIKDYDIEEPYSIIRYERLEPQELKH